MARAASKLARTVPSFQVGRMEKEPIPIAVALAPAAS
jgi:hypothetical protein